jgi:hypothetical protein
MKTDKPAFTTPEGRDWLIGLLKSEEYIDILFTKADGTERQMRCTLNENKIPADFAPKSTERKKSDECAIPHWCCIKTTLGLTIF